MASSEKSVTLKEMAHEASLRFAARRELELRLDKLRAELSRIQKQFIRAACDVSIAEANLRCMFPGSPGALRQYLQRKQKALEHVVRRCAEANENAARTEQNFLLAFRGEHRDDDYLAKLRNLAESAARFALELEKQKANLEREVVDAERQLHACTHDMGILQAKGRLSSDERTYWWLCNRRQELRDRISVVETRLNDLHRKAG